jgi:hypothetical protein
MLGLRATRISSAPLRLASAFARHRLRALSTESPASLATKLGADPASLDAFMAALPPAERKRVGLKFVANELEEEFGRADINRDGSLTFEEFKQWADELVKLGDDREQVKDPPTTYQLRAFYAQQMLPYVGFGLVDNALMVCMGEAIDGTLGVLLGLSTLGAAALGNAFSNGIGMGLHGVIERSAGALGLPDPRLTVHQRGLAVVKNLRMAAGITGVLLGCLLGMFPLFFMNAPSSQAHRKEVARRASQMD